MDQTTHFVQLPVLSQTALIALAVFCVLMFVGAIVLDIHRRRGAARQRVAAEWRAVGEIVEDRGFSKQETEGLNALVRRYAPGYPLRAVTVRKEFNACVEPEMEALAKRGDQKAFERTGAELREIRIHLGLDSIPLGQRITSSRELSPGQWMSAAKDGASDLKWFRMMVDEVDEAYFCASRHAKQKDAAPTFGKGDRVRCRLWRDEDARYVFTATVAEFDDPPPSWRFSHTEELNRVQARAHFRVRHDQATVVGVLNAPVDGDLKNVRKRRTVTRLRGRITSLSAGGCALVVQQSVAMQVLLRITVELPGERPLEVEAQIISVSPISGGRHLIRTAFVGLEDDRRDILAKYVLQRQQHLIQAQDKTQ